MHIFPLVAGWVSVSNQPVAMHIDESADFCYLLPALPMFVLQKGTGRGPRFRPRGATARPSCMALDAVRNQP